jgi:uncharacterized protein (DUF58 family)
VALPSQPTPSTDAFRQFDRLAFVARRPARAGIGGEHQARRPSPSTDFVDYRPYQPGDDFRRVDWNLYGRLGSLQVKVTQGRERLDILLVLDCSSSMAYGSPDKLAFGVQVVSALAYIGMARADSVRIACLNQGGRPEQRFGPFARRKRIPDVVRQLSQLAPTGFVDLNAGLTACLDPERAAHPLVVMVSDLLAADGIGDGLDALQLRGADVSVVHVVSAEELEPRLWGEVEIVDAESGGTLELGISQQTLTAYRARMARWLEERAADCLHRGMRYARVRTDRSLASVVLDDLRRAGLVR